METTEEVQEYFALGVDYLKSASLSFQKKLFEPALFNALHSLELFAKAAVIKKLGVQIKTHNVGGLFAQHYFENAGADVCRKLNRILSKYNISRYPGEKETTEKEVEEALDFANKFKSIVSELIN